MDAITFVLFISGFILLVVGAELLVRGASTLAIAVGISPLVVGLTVVAYGTSAPELAVTLNAAIVGQSDLGLGNIVGSNIANILLVLGLCAAIGTVVVKPQLVRQEMPLLILISALMLPMGLDGVIGRVDGIILSGGAIAYTIHLIRQSRQETKARQDYSPISGQSAKFTPTQLIFQLGLMGIGLMLLVIGANWLIDGAVQVAEMLGVSKLVIGLTIVAVGTSLPEIATSVIASVRGQRDIAVGNAVGSNIFNILLVLGLSAIFAPKGIVVPQSALTFDIPIMIAVAVAAILIFYTNFRIDRWEGAILLLYYAAYTLYLFLYATNHTALNEFQFAMTFFVIPITAIALVILTINAFRNPENSSSLQESPEIS